MRSPWGVHHIHPLDMRTNRVTEQPDIGGHLDRELVVVPQRFDELVQILQLPIPHVAAAVCGQYRGGETIPVQIHPNTSSHDSTFRKCPNPGGSVE